MFFFRDFVVLVRCCAVHRLVHRCLISYHVAVFVWFNHKLNRWFECQRYWYGNMDILVI